MPDNNGRANDASAYQYYRCGEDSYWRTDAAAQPGQQVQFLNSDGEWELAVLPTAADFLGEQCSTPMSASEALQAAEDRKRAEALAAQGVHPHVHQLRDITAEVRVGDHDAPIGVVEVADGEISVSVYVSPIDGSVVVQVDRHNDGRDLRITVNEERLFGNDPALGRR